MTQEEKKLLLNKDLCARLPYGFFVHRYSDNADIRIDSISTFGHFLEYSEGEDFKPYLRPMSSMTKEEKEEFRKLKQFSVTVIMPNGVSIFKPTYIVDLEDDGDGLNYLYDWLNAHHFDYRGLIPMGLTLEAPKGMYK